jgi:BMFP domain-containing protein YqiC
VKRILMGHNIRRLTGHSLATSLACIPRNSMSDPVQAWLTAQRELIERSLAVPTAEAVQGEVQRWWQAIAQQTSPQAQALAQQLMQLGPGFMAGAGDALFDLFGTGPNGKSQEATSRMLDLAPIGYFREHQADAQTLARALGDYGRIATEMASAIARVHSDALELLAQKTQALTAAGETVSDTHRLYALWIECGEQAFAQHARGEIFGRLQGELVNAGVQVRIAQQTIAESFLKSLDLPTRAELNSVHKRLQAMRERIEQLEQSAAGKQA